MSGNMIPIIAIVSVFSYLAWKRYLDYQQRMEALRRGIDPQAMSIESDSPTELGKSVGPGPARLPCDPRLCNMIWIAAGIAFMVAAFFSCGIAVGVWGLIPLAVGVGRHFYYSSIQKGEFDSYRRSGFTLIAVGVAYMICMTISISSSQRGMDRIIPMAVWGIVPIAIGAAMFIYSGMVRRERADEDQGPHSTRGM